MATKLERIAQLSKENPNMVWWFHEVVKPQLKGYAGIVNYADDFVVCF